LFGVSVSMSRLNSSKVGVTGWTRLGSEGRKKVDNSIINPVPPLPLEGED